MNQEEALNLHDACREFGALKKTGVLNQDQLDYELAVLSLEFLNDYGPEPNELAKPMIMHEYERMTDDEINDLSPMKSKELIDGYFNARKKWNTAQDSIRYQNLSNLTWLRKMETVLGQRNHQSTQFVKRLIQQHEIRGWSN